MPGTPPTAPTRALSIPEAAAYLGIGVRTLKGLLAARQIKFYRIGRRVVLRAIDLDRYLDQCAVRPARTHN